MRSWLVIVALSAGCLRTTSFVCESDTQCGAGGRCQPVGFCSFADGNCAGGQRFGDAAGSLSNTCVGDDGGVDAGVDAPTDPDATDAPPAGCPAGYATLTEAPPTQKYKLVTTLANWDTGQNLCVADKPGGGTYLAIPDDATELAAISTLTAAKYWIGVNDKATENTFVNVKGMPAFTMFGAGEPNDQGNQDCVAVLNNLMSTEKCGATALVYVCECDD